MDHLHVHVLVVCEHLYLLALFQEEEEGLWCFGAWESTTEDCVILEERRSGQPYVVSSWSRILLIVMVWFHPERPGVFDTHYCDSTMSASMRNTTQAMLVLLWYMYF